MIVADTNLIAYLSIPGDHTEEAERVYRKDPFWAAPLLWKSEFRNTLAAHVKYQKFDLKEAVRLMNNAALLLHQREFQVTSSKVLSLAVESGLTAYDCEFVSLAQELGIRLVTLDAKILAGFPNVALSPKAFIKNGKSGRNV